MSVAQQTSNSNTTSLQPQAQDGPHNPGSRALAVLRIATGLIFLWAFLDKLFGFNYATPPTRSWIDGGSPTSGFLSHVQVGPFQNGFQDLAGQGWADWIFMLGLAFIGLAVTSGIALRAAAISGTIMMALMWIAEWPPAKFTSEGLASGSTNPFLDYHLIYALILIVLAACAAGNTWGLGARWADTPLVNRRRWLR